MKIFYSLIFVLCINFFAKAQTAPAFWQDIVAFKNADAIKKVPDNAILFIGSSSFTKWQDVNDYFPGYTIINRGFGGSTLPDVIRYTYDILIPYHPKQVVIYCGENDIASADTITANEVLNRVKTLFSMIRINLPNTHIAFVSIKPSPVRAAMQDRVKKANQLIKAYFATQKNAAFIDIYDAMLNAHGQMQDELYVADKLHMKASGYIIWQKIIQPYLIK